MNKLYHVVRNNIKDNNKINGAVNNGLKLDSNYSLAGNVMNYPQPEVTISLR